MSPAADTRLKGATRHSMNVRCPRMAYYAYVGVDPQEPDEDTQRRWERGKMDERWYIERLRKKHGRRNVRTQKAVPWPNEGLPLGELHEDAFIVPLAQPVEVKSHLSGGAAEHDILQLAGALLYDDEAGDAGALVVLDRDLRERITVVTLDDELREQVESRAAALVEAVLNETEPARVCEKPSDGRALMCPFIGHCFDGWEAPRLPRVETEEVVMLARQLYELQLLKKGLNGTKVDEVGVADTLAAEGADAAIDMLRSGATVKAVEYLEKQVKEDLTEAIGRAPEDFLVDFGEYECGSLVLKRNVVNRSGYQVAPTSYEVLSVKRVSNSPLLSPMGREPEDFGSEAPF